LFHNANLFGSCIIHILYTGCAKIKKNNSGAKGLTNTRQHNKRLLEYTGYVFRPVNGSSSGLQRSKCQVLF